MSKAAELAWVANFRGEVPWDAISYPAREPYLVHPFLTKRRSNNRVVDILELAFNSHRNG